MVSLRDMCYHIGQLVIAIIVLQLLIALYRRCIRRATSWQHATDTWAIITGASYGVGKEIAFALARRHINGIVTCRKCVVYATNNDDSIVHQYMIDSNISSTISESVNQCGTRDSRKISTMSHTMCCH